jgi:hypothetical protein
MQCNTPLDALVSGKQKEDGRPMYKSAVDIVPVTRSEFWKRMEDPTLKGLVDKVDSVFQGPSTPLRVT